MNRQIFGNFSFRAGLRAILRFGLLASLGLLSMTSLPSQAKAEACCSITAVNEQTGIVTAKVNATGQTFQFKVTDASLLDSLSVGQGIYANFKTHEVSMDGRTPAGSIVSIGQVNRAKPITPVDAAKPSGPARSTSSPNPACCSITGINAAARLVAAKENSNAQGFEFSVPRSIPIQNLHVGGEVWANFKARKVSLDGKSACCDIVSLGKPTAPVAAGVQGNKPQRFVLPKLAFGALQPVKAPPPGSNKFVRYAAVGNSTLVHLHGLDGIKQASGLPPGVQDFLFLHARTLPPGEVDNYVVNVELAQKWFQTHQEPDYVRQAAKAAMGGGGSHAGCNSISVHCLGEAAQHVEYEAARQSEALRRQAGDEWRHISGQAEQEWHQVEGCFSDQTLDPLDGSFQFSIDPQFPFSFRENVRTKSNLGSVSGSITGNANLGVPLNGSFSARLLVSYILCLPFAIRPKSIDGDGTLGVGATLNATLNASGQFDQSFTVPPTGALPIPLYVQPITIDGVPISEMDTSVYLEGTLNVGGEGSLNGAIALQAHEETAFNFSCNGGSCSAGAHRVPVPDTATESVQVQGRIHVRPSLYAALQLALDGDLLGVRVGPEPYIYGEIYGCAAASGSQSTSGTSTSQEVNALTADVDWGIDLRGEVLTGGEKVWEHKWDLTKQISGTTGHLVFKDLAHSNALIPAVAGTTQPPLGQAAAFKVKMPTCYPYKDQIEYQLQWSGGATATGLAPAPNTSSAGNKIQQVSVENVAAKGTQGMSNPPANCTLQSGQADCWTDPLKDFPFNLRWPAAGNYNLTITPLRDQHGRKFDASDASQLNINVQ
jgi:hypothetical protein